MELFQILDCNSTIGSCCGNAAIVGVLDITRKIFSLLQIIVPMALVIGGTVQFVRLTINPEMKNGNRQLLNKLMAAILVFAIPYIIDAVLTAVPNSYSVSACWQEAKVSAETSRATSAKYVEIDNRKKVSVVIDPDQYEKPVATGVGRGTAKGKAIVAYASKYVGKPYKFGGYWNGEDPYTPTDCSGFVTAIFRHFGINLPRGVNMFGYDTSLYDVVSANDIQAGDVIMYNGHVGILTGNGKEVIHAASTKLGVIKSDDYTKCSSHAILGILRIKGV